MTTFIIAKLKTLSLTILAFTILFATINFTFKVSTVNNFTLGVSAPIDENGLGGWVPDSKIPFDHAYQYLVGGVNTNSGWQNWSSNGNFPLEYAKKASAQNIAPVFTYYQILQSNGDCNNCEEAHKDISNLNNKKLMKAYYDDFMILMQKLGSVTFAKNPIVQIEPDLSGFAQQATNDKTKCFGFCTGSWGNPDILKAEVESTGNKDLAGLPNNYNGYNLALLKLRDKYAPNVKLAITVSPWASGKDIASDKSNLNEWALGWSVGNFTRNSEKNDTKLNISKYDYIFTDVADRDAGFYQYIYGDDSRWWDTQNKLFPNFNRWENYINMINQLNNKPIIVWQIPIGNQLMRSQNNTWGHFQDNKLQYFLDHINELKSNGITGLLFGSGNAGSTYHYDNNYNGKTNPDQVCNSTGNSSGSKICSQYWANESDDDGGYLRSKSKEFYGLK